MSIKVLVRGLALASLLCAHFATPAAATVITFDGFNGQQLPYWEEQSFLFDPAKSNNDSKCYETECLMEIGQGQLTTMTYDASNGGPYGGKEKGEVIDPSSNYGDVFDLDFFYFVLVGNGDGIANSFTVTGTKQDASMVTATFYLGQTLGAVNTDAFVSFAADADTNQNDVDNGVIQKNVGYWVDLGDAWHDIIAATWSVNTWTVTKKNGEQSTESAQMRLDCVGAFEEGKGSESLCDPTTVVPVPAALPLLLTGIGAVGLVARRRKKAKAA